MIPVARLNHAVLYVRDAEAAAEFYGRVFGFEVVSSELGGRAGVMGAGGGGHHHHPGAFSRGPPAPRPPRGPTRPYPPPWGGPPSQDPAPARHGPPAAAR